MSNTKLFNVNQKLDKHQHLSDLMDDQVTEQTIDKAVDKLLADESQSEVWFRYNLVSSVLKEEQSAFASFNFTQAVSAQIAKESSHKVTPTQTAQIIPFWKKTGSGFAIAASVAFAMVFSVQMMNTSSEQSNAGAGIVVNQPTKVSPLIISSSEFDEGQNEQAQLNDIQRYLNQINQRSLNVNEQLVGGEVMVKSFIVKTKDPVTPFEEKIREMKKPSEANK